MGCGILDGRQILDGVVCRCSMADLKYCECARHLQTKPDGVPDKFTAMVSYPPDEPASTILLEQTFVAGDFICGIGYGMSSAPCTSGGGLTRVLWHRNPDCTLLLMCNLPLEAAQE